MMNYHVISLHASPLAVFVRTCKASETLELNSINSVGAARHIAFCFRIVSVTSSGQSLCSCNLYANLLTRTPRVHRPSTSPTCIGYSQSIFVVKFKPRQLKPRRSEYTAMVDKRLEENIAQFCGVTGAS